MGTNTNFKASRTSRRRIGAIAPDNAGNMQLLPGLHDDMTKTLIIPKLSWSDIELMSSVNAIWKEAVKSHQVYDIRVRTCSTETLAVVVSNKRPEGSSPKMGISLYSIRDKSWREVPPIPGLPHGLPLHCQCVSLDGKLYVLGGDVTMDDLWSAEVYVLDLAGQGMWKALPSMQEPRRRFAAAVMNGTIYVFGGTQKLIPNVVMYAFADFVMVPSVTLCEAYVPNTNSWVHKGGLDFLRSGHRASTMGQELLLHGGNHLHLDEFQANGQVFDPINRTWRLVEDFIRISPSEVLFSVGGKLLAMTNRAIHVFDVAQQAWTVLQSCSPPVIGGTTLQVGPEEAPLAVGDELLIVAHSLSDDGAQSFSGLFSSKGFDKNEVVAWESVPCPHHSREQCSCLGTCAFLCSIQL